LLTQATAVAVELQVTEARVCVLLSLKEPVAMNRCAVVRGIDEFTGLTAIETSPGRL
jgi:hypothetical protein